MAIGEKPVEEMTPDEVQAERAEIARLRAEIAESRENPKEYAESLEARAKRSPEAQARLAEAIFGDDPEDPFADPIPAASLFPPPVGTAEEPDPQDASAPEDEPDAAEPAPEPWPFKTIDFKGMILQVRVPDQSALVGVTMASAPGLPPQAQLRIFTKFLMNHMSATTFVQVVELMMDPDSDVTIQDIVSRLASLGAGS